ncbi:MAG: sulfite exporter TauE/SafE family protein [Gammaproteobacteria bacterium]|nr:sulfite exporter TauE/SafE family protein [Gammaproteobacteria bacterium]
MLLTPLLALLIGLTLGVFGAGGSLLTVALLVYEDLSAQEAISASLLVVALTAAVALVQHARHGNVRWRVGLLFGGAGMLGAYAGGFAAGYLPSGLLLLLLAGVMFGTALMLLRPPSAGAEKTEACAPSRAKVARDALLVGALTGLIGAGGGFIVVPALVLLYCMPMREAVGTSLLVILLNTLAGYAGHSTHGIEINYPLVLSVTGFAIAGTFLGHALSRRLPVQRLKKAFAWFMMVIAAWLVYQEIPIAWSLPGI